MIGEPIKSMVTNTLSFHGLKAERVLQAAASPPPFTLIPDDDNKKFNVLDSSEKY